MTNIPHLIEAALLLLVAYLIGCLIGYFLRASVFKKASAPTATPVAAMAKPAPVRTTAAPATSAPSQAAPAATKKPAAKKSVAKTASGNKTASGKKAAVKKPAAKTTRKPAAKPADPAPKKLDAPRNGQKDNLKTIKGIGPKIEGQLNALGVYHFDQIAEWDRATIVWVDSHLSFKGRVDREKWVSQAKTLAKSAK